MGRSRSADKTSGTDSCHSDSGDKRSSCYGHFLPQFHWITVELRRARWSSIGVGLLKSRIRFELSLTQRHGMPARAGLVAAGRNLLSTLSEMGSEASVLRELKRLHNQHGLFGSWNQCWRHFGVLATATGNRDPWAHHGTSSKSMTADVLWDHVAVEIGTK